MDVREEKKSQFADQKARSKSPLALVVALVIVAVAAAVAFTLVGQGGANEFVQADKGVVTIRLNEVADGRAHYFAYKAQDGTPIRFFVLKSHDGEFRAAFDACDVCYKAKKGYRQEGDDMVCNNCEQKFASNRINEVKGGCNPAPLTRTLQGDKLLLNEQELIDGRRYFPQI